MKKRIKQIRKVKEVLDRYMALPRTPKQIKADLHDVREQALGAFRSIAEDIHTQNPIMMTNVPMHVDSLNMTLAVHSRLVRLAEREGIDVPPWPELAALDEVAEFAMWD